MNSLSKYKKIENMAASYDNTRQTDPIDYSTQKTEKNKNYLSRYLYVFYTLTLSPESFIPK